MLKEVENVSFPGNVSSSNFNASPIESFAILSPKDRKLSLTSTDIIQNLNRKKIVIEAIERVVIVVRKKGLACTTTRRSTTTATTSSNRFGNVA
jgi:hypothetical protein